MRQKLRHTSAGRFYDRAVQAHLAVFHASNLLVWLAPAVLGWTGAGLLAIRFLVQRAALNRAAEALGEKDLMLPQPLLDLGYALYNSLLAPSGTLHMARRGSWRLADLRCGYGVPEASSAGFGWRLTTSL